jgi:hypothetical protein
MSHYEDVSFIITNVRGENAYKNLLPLFTAHIRKGNNIVDYPPAYYAKSIYASGRSNNGMLGLGVDGNIQTTPKQLSNVKDIFCFGVGGHHAHASTGTMLNKIIINNTAHGFFSWGSGRYAQLGDGNEIMSTTPVEIHCLKHTRMAHIAGSFSHTVALTGILYGYVALNLRYWKSVRVGIKCW